jgi:hypothetical protein
MSRAERVKRIGCGGLLTLLFATTISTAQTYSDSVTAEAGPAISDSIMPTAIDTALTTLRSEPRRLFDTLIGPLPQKVPADTIPYFIAGDIEVPAGTTVVIEPGAHFLFKGFTGLHVQGKLLAQGTKDRPIIFTSEKDHAVNSATTLYANPYDWNGIYIHSDAVGTILSQCTVAYSVYGIVSETKFFRLDQVALRMNGKSNVVIDGKEQSVGATPFSYALSITDVKAQGVPVKILNDPLAFRRNTIRSTGFTLLTGAAATGIYYGMQWKNNQNKLTGISTDDPLVLRSSNESDWLALRNNRNRDRSYTLIAGGLVVLGAAGFIWSFTF